MVCHWILMRSETTGRGGRGTMEPGGGGRVGEISSWEGGRWGWRGVDGLRVVESDCCVSRRIPGRRSRVKFTSHESLVNVENKTAELLLHPTLILFVYQRAFIN